MVNLLDREVAGLAVADFTMRPPRRHRQGTS
jgi:hypothetical protein